MAMNRMLAIENHLEIFLTERMLTLLEQRL